MPVSGGDGSRQSSSTCKGPVVGPCLAGLRTSDRTGGWSHASEGPGSATARKGDRVVYRRGNFQGLVVALMSVLKGSIPLAAGGTMGQSGCRETREEAIAVVQAGLVQRGWWLDTEVYCRWGEGADLGAF